MNYKKYIFFVLLCLLILPIKSFAQTGFVSIAGNATNPDLVNIRKEASGKSEVIDQIYFGTKVEILETVGNYYKVNYGGRTPGYIYNTVVELVPDYPTDNDYCNYLKSIGFDETYCPYLTYLHQKHPSWVFTPNVLNLDFKEAISGEEGKNLVQLATSLDINYFLNKYIKEIEPVEGSNWFKATDSFNAYFLDPRNFLNERFIFMYQDLGCGPNSIWRNNRDLAINTMTNIVSPSSYLSTSRMTDGNGNPYSYLDVFYNAGLDNNISPIHLVSRVKQEGGANENYGPITGNATITYNNYSLKGYYNYYNIGAYKDKNTNNPQARGLAYACGPACGFGSSYLRPWDTREKAINGGAMNIANNYISVGQTTLYLQKFDVVGDQKYTNQYMANVTAPLSEGINTYLSFVKNNLVYSNGNIDLANEMPIEFSIPVYQNMGIPYELPSVIDGVNTLSNILINNEPINGFDPDITEYTKYVINTYTSVNLDYQKNNSATVTGSGEIKLDNDTTDAILEVVAQNGSKKQYVIHIIKVADTKSIQDIVSNIGVKSTDDVFYGLEFNTSVQTIINTINSVSPLANVTIYNKDGNVVTNTEIYSGYKIVIKTATGEEKSFFAAVTGDPNGDGVTNIYDLLKVQKHLLNDTLLQGYEYRACDMDGNGSIDLLDILKVQKKVLEQLGG